MSNPKKKQYLYGYDLAIWQNRYSFSAKSFERQFKAMLGENCSDKEKDTLFDALKERLKKVNINKKALLLIILKAIWIAALVAACVAIIYYVVPLVFIPFQHLFSISMYKWGAYVLGIPGCCLAALFGTCGIGGISYLTMGGLTIGMSKVVDFLLFREEKKAFSDLDFIARSFAEHGFERTSSISVDKLKEIRDELLGREMDEMTYIPNSNESRPV